MGKPNPDAINSLMGIIEIFSYISIVFTLVFLFYFVRGEILGRKLERQRIIYALLYLVMGFSLNLLVSFLFEINFAGLYVNAGIFVFALLFVSVKAIVKKEYRIFGEIPFDRWFGIAFILMLALNCALVYTTIYKLYVESADTLFKIQSYGFAYLILTSIVVMLAEKLFKNIKIKSFLRWLKIPITSLAFANIAISAFFTLNLYTVPTMDVLSHVYSPFSRFVKIGKTEINIRAFGKEEVDFLENEVNSGKDPKEIEREFLKKYTSFYENNAEQL